MVVSRKNVLVHIFLEEVRKKCLVKNAAQGICIKACRILKKKIKSFILLNPASCLELIYFLQQVVQPSPGPCQGNNALLRDARVAISPLNIFLVLSLGNKYKNPLSLKPSRHC